MAHYIPDLSHRQRATRNFRTLRNAGLSVDDAIDVGKLIADQGFQYGTAASALLAARCVDSCYYDSFASPQKGSQLDRLYRTRLQPTTLHLFRGVGKRMSFNLTQTLNLGWKSFTSDYFIAMEFGKKSRQILFLEGPNYAVDMHKYNSYGEKEFMVPPTKFTVEQMSEYEGYDIIVIREPN